MEGRQDWLQRVHCLEAAVIEMMMAGTEEVAWGQREVGGCVKHLGVGRLIRREG